MPEPRPSFIFFEVSAYRSTSVLADGPALYDALAASLRAQGYRKVQFVEGLKASDVHNKDELWGRHEPGTRPARKHGGSQRTSLNETACA